MIDHLPESSEEEAAALSKLLWAHQVADEARSKHEANWLRWYQIYNNYVEAEDKKEDNWRSKMGIAAVFYIVETVAPRLVAQLPEGLVLPVGAEDVQGAEVLKDAIEWAAEVSELYVQLVDGMKDALNYGTGILKTFADEKTAYEQIQVPILEPVVSMMPVVDPETGQPLLTPDEQIQYEEQVVGQRPTGQYETQRRPYTYYRGPFAEAVDLFNFWFAPECSGIDDARWVIQRTFMAREDFEKLVSKGYYRKPDYMSDGDFYAFTDDPKFKRYAAVGLSGSRPNDPSFDGVMLDEYWFKNGRKVCVANQRAIVSAEANPFNHGQKPYIRLVDHRKAHEPYGIGEIQMLEGQQDAINALVNARIDAVKLALNLMFFVDEDALVSTSDLRVRPGGRVRVRNRYGLPLDQIIKKIDFGDTTNSSYMEVDKMYESLERISGVAGPPGPEDAGRYRTATGVMSIDEGMASRFAHKLKMMELTGFQRLFEQYGTLLQQYVDREFSRRRWKNGEWDFVSIDPSAIQGRFQYGVKAESSALSKTNERDEALLLYHETIQNPYVNPTVPLENVLKKHGIKDIQRWLAPPEQQLMMLLQSLPPGAIEQVVSQMADQEEQVPGEEQAPAEEQDTGSPVG